jgi:hypothetical protein
MPDMSPLSPEQKQQLADAGERSTKILGAARVAAFNGWTIGFFAAVSLLFAFSGLTALLMGLGLGWIAWNEFKGRDRLRAFDPTAATFLGKNQLHFMGLVLTYALWSVYRTLTEPIPHLDEIEEAIGPIGDLVTSITVSVYLVVILLTVLFQGLNAKYYFARGPMLEEYLKNTPEWVVEMRKTVGQSQ